MPPRVSAALRGDLSLLCSPVRIMDFTAVPAGTAAAAALALRGADHELEFAATSRVNLLLGDVTQLTQPTQWARRLERHSRHEMALSRKGEKHKGRNSLSTGRDCPYAYVIRDEIVGVLLHAASRPSAP